MQERSREFLKRLLGTPGPSGFEARAAAEWRREAETFAETVEADVNGNSMATVGGDGAPRVMLAGHIDEIGFMITHVDDDGFLYFDAIGGWDPQVVVGQRLRVLARERAVPAVVGKKPIHLMKGDEKEKASKLTDLWLDVGAADRDSVAALGIRVGDAAVIDAPVLELGDDRIVSRSIDNRIGAFVVLEALRMLAEDRPRARVTAVATTQEEIGFFGGGARSSAFRLEPDVAMVVDVTFSSDAPGLEKKELGDHKLGGGPVLARGSAASAVVFERLARIAEREEIPHTLAASPRFTATDADAIYLTRSGVATGLISVPNRYMHSPNEMVALSDLDAAARLIAAFCRDLSAEDDFVPR